ILLRERNSQIDGKGRLPDAAFRSAHDDHLAAFAALLVFLVVSFVHGLTSWTPKCLLPSYGYFAAADSLVFSWSTTRLCSIILSVTSESSSALMSLIPSSGRSSNVTCAYSSTGVS